jgi:thiamine pyrophosphate-dependent acetolactate synthase large subunit-like protein
MTRYMDGGEALIEAFRALGIEHVFCSSGSEWAPVWEAVTRQKVEGRPGPAYHDLMHETLAVDLAIGFTLVTGRMQAVLLHAVPGLLQGACGIHGALLSEVPMLVLSSEANSYGDRDSVDPGSQWYRNLSVVGGPHSVVDRIVKWSCQVPGIETLYEFVKRAGEIAQRTPEGPVYLNAPVEVLLERWAEPATLKNVAAPGLRIAPEADIDALVAAIEGAEDPIVITESVGRTPGGLPALVAFAEAFGLPVYESPATVACNFPRSHPLFQGGNVDGQRGKADLILLVNARSPWYPPSKVFPGVRVIVIDEVPQRPHMVYQVLQADRHIEGDVPSTLQSAAARATAGAAARRARAEAGHERLIGQWSEAEAKAASEDGISPIHLAARLRAAMPQSALIFDETITHGRVVRDHVRPEAEGSYSYVQGGLGQGIGVALGGKLAAPDRLVVLAVGDGSFLYNPIVQALTASREMRLPILIVVFNNRQYLSMKMNHLRFYPDGQSVEHDLFHGVDLSGQPRIEEVAKACGARGVAVQSRAALDDAIHEALRTVTGGQTCVLNVIVNR